MLIEMFRMTKVSIVKFPLSLKTTQSKAIFGFA